MATYTGVADANGDFSISFGTNNYTSGEKITVTAEKDNAEKSIELYAPTTAVGGGVIQFSGNLTNFPINIGVVTIGDVGESIAANAFNAASAGGDFIFLKAGGLVLSPPLQTIGITAFSTWSSAVSLVLPTSLKVIRSGAFSSWRALTSLTLNEGLTTLESNAFISASALLSLRVPSSVLSIASGCFSGLAACKKVELMGQVTSIGITAFSNLIACDEFILHATTPPAIQANTFNALKSTCVFKVPAASVAAYQAAPNWSAFASRIQAI